MKKLIFKPSDFAGNKDFSGLYHDLYTNTKIAAKLSQDLFESWFKENIENAPTVYYRNRQWTEDEHGSINNEIIKLDTKRAKLINVEEIK